MEREKYINSINLNTGTDFPYLVLDVANGVPHPRNLGFQVMHWHEDLQFIYVLAGTIEVRTLDTVIAAEAGEGVFINANVVHYVGRRGNCHYNSFLFPAYFLGFYAGSPAKAFVDGVTENGQIPLFHFSSKEEGSHAVLSLLRQLAELEKNKTEFYSYEVLVLLSSLWLAMRKNLTLPPEKKESTLRRRMQKILSYIARHFGGDLTLEDLANSANISKSECSRCFRLSLNTTPYKYLAEFRLSEAARLLKNTDRPIGDIAAAVGFHQMSHFGKCFREKTGYSPREYRNLQKRNKAAPAIPDATGASPKE